MSTSSYAPKIWTKEFTAIFAFHFILMGAMYSTLVTVGNYAIEKYDVNPSIAGFVASIFIVGVLVGRESQAIRLIISAPVKLCSAEQYFTF